MKFILVTSALMTLLSLLISPNFVYLPLIPLILYLHRIKVKPYMTAILLLLSLPLDNMIIYGTVLELVLISG
ncbi:hypothetical protein [Sulfurisphaera ohwakuensis]|uniref:Uncharacterized protein n=1 Tax=Sulfurisphaera ohwakuensis TaxID=69656 RepID=A0A650CIM6_SULOH|nr:hypothetical protein [Sulfurisphaera ohwakuensis]MBB5253800.1 hypothetical protein [Sulfurisphaera ohwakuensis]QGR17525.1 hypothetical protein D1869_10245 [Sulfurisphaera ohwakuensis]